MIYSIMGAGGPFPPKRSGRLWRRIRRWFQKLVRWLRSRSYDEWLFRIFKLGMFIISLIALLYFFWHHISKLITSI
jgi:hypothetical protein